MSDLTDKQRLDLINKIINTAWEAYPGDAFPGYWLGVVIAVEAVMKGDEEDE